MKTQLKKSFGTVAISGVTKNDVEYLETHSCNQHYQELIFYYYFSKIFFLTEIRIFFSVVAVDAHIELVIVNVFDEYPYGLSSHYVTC